MSNKVNPHELVAVMSYGYRGRQKDFPHRLDTTDHTLVAGIAEDRETNLRTFPVLDALASITVYEEEHKVYTIALQVNAANCKIRLSMAGNKGVEDKVVNHITNIWAKLQDLSNQYAENRGGEPKKGEKSPAVPDEVGIPLRIEIFREVYLFCLKKHIKRVSKWKDRFVAFMREFSERRKGTFLRGFDRDLHQTATSLLLLLKSLNKLYVYLGTKLRDDKWQTMYDKNILASEGVERVLGKKLGEKLACEALASELIGIIFRFPLLLFSLCLLQLWKTDAAIGL